MARNRPMTWMQRIARPFLPTSRAAAPPPNMIGGELGVHGSSIWDGLVQDDYNTALQFPKSIQTYQRMRLSDAQVQAIETVISLPARTVRYYIQPGDDSKASAEATDLLERNLLDGDGMSHSFDDLLRKALVSVMLGFQVFERVWVEEGGYIRFRKFADRHPLSIEKWLFDAEGGLAGIKQRACNTAGQVVNPEIPIDKLTVFSYRTEWGNPEGLPLCRPMYKHWYIKDALYRIANIGAERDCVGTPVGKAPAGATDTDKSTLKAILEGIRAYEGAAIVLPPGFELDSYHAGANIAALMTYIEHHDIAMTRVALASFINLVGQGTGSRALSADQSQFFLLCEEAIVRWLCATLNQYAIAPLCEWNWPGLKSPRLMAAHVDSILQPVAIGHALAALVNKQLLTPDREVENAVREMMNLPEIPEGQQRNTPPLDLASPSTGSAGFQPAAVGSSVVAPSAHTAASDDHPRASMPEASARRLQAAIQQAEDILTSEGRKLLLRQLDGFEQAAAPIVEQALAATPLTRGKAHLALADLTLPYRAEYRAWLKARLLEFVRQGMESARDAGQDVGPIPNELRSFVDCQATLLADKHCQDLRFAAVSRLQRDIDAKLGRDAAMHNVRNVLRDQASKNLAGSLRDSQLAIADQISAYLAESAQEEIPE